MASAPMMALRPQPGDYGPSYEAYVSLVPGTDIISSLEQQRQETRSLLASRAETAGDLRYAPGKWTVREVLGHVIDTERIMSYRALRIARGDTTSLPGFEQDDYVRNANFAQRTLADLLDEFALVRQSTIALLRSLDSQAWERRGTANNNVLSVRALAFVIAGHELHHRKILEEKYLVAR